MALFPTFHEWVLDRATRAPVVEGKAKTPNYSFDNFVHGAEKLKGDVDSMIGQAKDKEAEIDRKAKSKKEKSRAEDEYEDKPENGSNEKAWKQLRKIHKDRAPDFEKRLEKSQESSEK
tara:strand:- start:322 stop:675 length:354 start_codon:yes stop_codon:yes gene_type:complete